MPFVLNNRRTFPPELPIGVSEQGDVTVGDYTLAMDDFKRLVEYVLDRPLDVAADLEKYGVDLRLELVMQVKRLRLLRLDDGRVKFSLVGEEIDP